MYKIRFILACWCCACFLHGTSSAIAQLGTITYPFVNEGSTVGLYPYYGVIPNQLSGNYNNFAVNGYNITNSNEGALSQSQLITVFLAALEKRGITYQALSDFGTADGWIYELQLPSSHFSFTNNSYSKPTAVFFKTYAKIVYRLTPFPNQYDVFCYWYVTGVSVGSANLGALVLDESTSNIIAYSSFNGASLGLHTYICSVVFRVQLSGDSYQLINTDTWGLPFDIDRETSNILVYTGRPNSYWNTPTKTLIATDYINMSVFSTTQNDFNINYYSSAFPLYNSPSWVYPSGNNSAFHHTYDNDTDSGGMKDYYEWFQTSHDLLDPQDDDDNTSSLPLPDPEEGESVVDIGRDTVNRYDQYWQEQVGDTNDLEPIQPSNPNLPQDITPEDIDLSSLVTDVETTLDSSLEQSQFKSNFDDVFRPLSSSDQKLTWSFNPSVNNSLVTFPLETITIDPQAVVNDSNFGSFFVLFRGCLVLFEFLVFVYGMYKMALSNISGTSNNTDDET